METQPTYPVHEVAVHERPHLDELCGLLMLMLFGDERFPGIGDAIRAGQILFVADGATEDGQTAAEWLDRGRLYVGLGYGLLDEHRPAGNGDKVGTSCSQLVAEYLGVDARPEWKGILAYTLQTDRHGEQANSRQEARSRLKTMVDNGYRRTPEDPMRVLLMAFDAILDWVHADEEVLEAVADDLAQAPVHEFSQGGETRQLVVIETDNEFALEGAMASGFDAVITKNSNGNVGIFAKKKARLAVRDLAALVRIEERRLHDGVELQRELKYQQLKEQGTLEESPLWHYQSAGGFILNGSQTHPEVTPSSIPLDNIVALTLIAFSDDRWPRDRAPRCTAGQCTHSRQSSCRWAWMGLQRCYQLQQAAKEAQST